MMHVIEEGLYRRDYRRQERTDNFERSASMVDAYTPERVAKICGIRRRNDSRGRPGRSVRAKRAMIFWGMGISQHVLRHEQFPLSDRSGPDLTRQRREGRVPACIRCAARTTCRARATRG